MRSGQQQSEQSSDGRDGHIGQDQRSPFG
jgi:hypothetical protein